MRKLSAIVLAGAVVMGIGCGGEVNSQEAPDAVIADPQHYSVEFENDIIRILRVEYGPGETSTMHRHPANCAIFINDASATFELPSGEVVDAPGTAGQVICGDSEAHLPTNTGDGQTRVIVVELKGRDVFAQ
jgi:hypothetical protein